MTELPENSVVLRQLRKGIRMTQEQMAAHLGVTRSYYNQVETGRKELTGHLQEKVDIMLTSPALKSEHSEGSLKEHQRELPPSPIRPDYEVISLNEDQAPRAPKEPQAEDCKRYLETYLSHALKIPGGVGHCLTQLKMHLPIENIKRLTEEES